MRTKPYPSDLTDAEWEILKGYLPGPKLGGRPRSTNLREVLNAIFYVLKTGCQWDMLPHGFPLNSSEAMIYLAMIRLMLRRLACSI